MVLFSSFYYNLAFAPAVLDSMIEGIFCKWLKRKFWNRDFSKFFRYVDLKFQNIPVAVLLDFQIT